ncbi:hypothetical protein QSQ_1168 [Clostridioides difficile P32]|nr:hypothetical protein QSG_1468 [Clostridioides difficile P25]EQJ61597.1 hypothetical protein QSQ_1168 [Clostridioides difficile P32]
MEKDSPVSDCPLKRNTLSVATMLVADLPALIWYLAHSSACCNEATAHIQISPVCFIVNIVLQARGNIAKCLQFIYVVIGNICHGFTVGIIVNIVLVFHDFLQRPIMTNKFVQTIHDIVGKFLYHFIHFIEFINGNILPNLNREVIGIMDCVFFILFIQADFFFHIFLVNRESKPSTD